MHWAQGMEKLRESPPKAGADAGLATVPGQQVPDSAAAESGGTVPILQANNLSVLYFCLPSSVTYANPTQCGEVWLRGLRSHPSYRPTPESGGTQPKSHSPYCTPHLQPGPAQCPHINQLQEAFHMGKTDLHTQRQRKAETAS